MRIKLISDGTPLGTKVVNVKTGEEILGIKGVTFHLDTKMMCADVILTFLHVPIEFEAEVTRVIQEETKNAD